MKKCLESNKFLYFASDFHLGLPSFIHSRKREQLIIEWLDSIKSTTAELFLVGDVFDFWYEYKSVVPKGYIRFLAKIAEFTDAGIPVHLFKGNHDMWMKNYLTEEIGVIIHDKPFIFELDNVRFLLHHGHALGKYDKGMRFLNGVFSSKILQWFFSRIHPNTAFKMAHSWSVHNRTKKVYESDNYLGDEKEYLLHFCIDMLKKEHIDYFIFGHRHLAIDRTLNENSRYINLGNWITNSSFAVFDGKNLKLQHFRTADKDKIIR